MSDKNKIKSLFRHYFVYLGLFTAEIIAVVGYFTWRNREIFINDAIVTKFNLAEKYVDEYEVLFNAYMETMSHYYLMAGIIIFSVLAMAVTIHILMRKWITDFEQLNYLEDVTKNSRDIMEKESKYRSLFENNGTAILIVGDNELISDCNRKFVELSGYDRDEIIGKLHWEKIVHEDDLKRVDEYDRLRKSEPQNAPMEYTMKFKRKDGSLRHVIVTVILMAGTEELASMVDITDLIEKDAALKENEALLSQAQEIACMGSWTYLPSTDEIIASKEFFRILNVPYEYRTALEKLRQEMRFEQFYNELRVMHSEKDEIDKEITYLDRNSGNSDKTRHFRIKARNITTEDKNKKVSGILLDITEKKNIENEVKRTAEDMKNLIFLSTHDLQAPIIAVEGFSKLLLQTLSSSELDSTGRKYLEKIISNVKSMNELFRNFYNVSKLNTVKNSFEMINIPELIDQSVSENKIMIEKYNAEISLENREKIPGIFADKENMKLLFHHLITNAVVYGGKNISVGYNDNSFFVRDDGSGIESGDLEKIFSPGFRSDKVSSLGSGVGLAFCKKVIELHNGRIWALSEGKGKGTEIRFTLSYELIRD